MAMSSLTRVTRNRTDGPHQPYDERLIAKSTRSSHHHHHHNIASPHRGSSDPASKKRGRPRSERDFDPVKTKKQRIAIDITSKPPVRSKIAPDAVTASRLKTASALAGRNSAAFASNANLPSLPRSETAIPVPAPPAQPKPTTNTQPKYKGKLVNGLRHELEELKPNKADVSSREQGRKLRSQEATRFKSDLSAYFPDYDEVIGNDPKEQHILNLETPILLTDSASTLPHGSGSLPLSSKPTSATHLQPAGYPVRSFGDNLYTDLFNAQRVEISHLFTNSNGADPLPDSTFEPAHRKAERLERSIRNSEKGRAQHEKDQIVRLLEGLQGPDWLRVMGVSGITESRKKTFEPARAHFVKGCYAILQKFRTWAAWEKRRKLEKERAAAEAEAEEEVEGEEVDGEEDEDEEQEPEEGEEEDEDEAEGSEVKTEAANMENAEEVDGSDAESDGDPPDFSDEDTSPARQLRNEAIAAARTSSKRSRTGPPSARPPPELEPQKEFTSFFRMKYQRDAALSKSRRRGRTVVAWGQPVPEPAEEEFDLPEELRDAETLRVHARRKRRDKRGKH